MDDRKYVELKKENQRKLYIDVVKQDIKEILNNTKLSDGEKRDRITNLYNSVQRHLALENKTIHNVYAKMDVEKNNEITTERVTLKSVFEDAIIQSCKNKSVSEETMKECLPDYVVSSEVKFDKYSVFSFVRNKQFEKNRKFLISLEEIAKSDASNLDERYKEILEQAIKNKQMPDKKLLTAIQVQKHAMIDKANKIMNGFERKWMHVQATESDMDKYNTQRRIQEKYSSFQIRTDYSKNKKTREKELQDQLMTLDFVINNKKYVHGSKRERLAEMKSQMEKLKTSGMDAYSLYNRLLKESTQLEKEIKLDAVRQEKNRQAQKDALKESEMKDQEIRDRNEKEAQEKWDEYISDIRYNQSNANLDRA